MPCIRYIRARAMHLLLAVSMIRQMLIIYGQHPAYVIKHYLCYVHPSCLYYTQEGKLSDKNHQAG